MARPAMDLSVTAITWQRHVENGHRLPNANLSPGDFFDFFARLPHIWRPYLGRPELTVRSDTPAIRLLTPEDAGIFRQIRLEALRADSAAFASQAQDWESLSLEEWTHRLTANAVFIAFREGEPVGIMGLMRQQASKTAHRGTVIMVYVRATCRGYGIAAALMARLAEFALTAGIVQLELAANAENAAAIQFYRREGFAEIGRIPAGFLHEGREIDEILMAKRIAT
jgi:GNAT superfamily N-acetyltransferase